METTLAYRARRCWKAARWGAAALGLVVLWACNAHSLEKPIPHPSVVDKKVFKGAVNRQIDILFMVDNSNSMAKLQNKLLEPLVGFPVFMEVLKKIPAADGSGVRGLPDVHIAVVSSDVGAGELPTNQVDAPAGCSRRWGDNGVFQTAPRGTCPASPLPDDQHFLAASNDQALKNYTGDITDAFTCIARLGEGGCGFEGQLKAVRLALDPAIAPPENAGFLRKDAYLAVILITNEDDCSLPDDSDFADPSQDLVSDPLGPMQFRCNEFGHLCKIDGTLQPPPRAPATGLTECVSNDTPTGRLTRVADEVAFLNGLKDDPSHQILVAAITGPAAPYDIIMTDEHRSRLEPGVKHSCVQDTGEYADPSVRIQQWVKAFGDNGHFLSICADTFAPALTEIANALSALLEPVCIEETFQTRGDNVPDCAVIDRFTNENGKIVETALSACAENDNKPPCWSLEDGGGDGGAACAGKKQLKVNRGPDANIPTSLNTEIQCALCVPGAVPQAPGCPP